jgi:hypothetical protein
MTRLGGAYLLTFRKGAKRQYYSILNPSPGKMLQFKNSAGKDQLPYTQLVFVQPKQDPWNVIRTTRRTHKVSIFPMRMGYYSKGQRKTGLKVKN